MSTCSVAQTASSVITGSTNVTAASSVSFVQRSGSSLTLDGRPWRASGPNIYWLARRLSVCTIGTDGAQGLDENVDPSPSIPSRQRVLDALATASAMGANAIRCHTCGVSLGCAVCMENALGVFNEEAMRAVDFVFFAARLYNLRVIVPLTDFWDYYHGGIATFLRWRGLDPTDYGAFYDTSSQVHADFQLYIRTLLSRNNTITGIPWGRDPAIAAWETGNELGGWERKAMPPAEWTSSVAKTVRALAPATLVVDGTYGLNEEAMALPEIDIVTNHFYPTYANRIRSDSSKAAGYNKAYMIGEFDWTDRFQRLNLLGALIPVLVAIIVLLLPQRWFPIHLRLPAFRRRQPSRYETIASTPLSPLPSSLADAKDFDAPPPLPELSSPVPSRHKRTWLVRKWHLSLLIVLVFVPIAILAAWFTGPTSLSGFLDAAADSSTSGSFYWSLFGRSSDCCSFIPHDDGYTLHWPGDNNDMRSRAYKLAEHARRMTGRSLPPGARDAGDIGVACPQADISGQMAKRDDL